MALSNDFTSYFSALPFNDEGNRNTKAFTEAMVQESEKAMMKLITDDQNYVLFGADSRGRIRIIHSVKNLGGTMLRSQDKLAALLGTLSNAICVELDPSIAQSIEFGTPTYADIKGCNSKEDFVKLTDPDDTNHATRTNSIEVYKGCKVFIASPWLRDAVLNSDSLEPHDAANVALTAAMCMEEDMKDDEVFKENDAVNHAKEFAKFMWGVANQKVPETRFEINLDDGELTAHADERQRFLL